MLFRRSASSANPQGHASQDSLGSSVSARVLKAYLTVSMTVACVAPIMEILSREREATQALAHLGNIEREWVQYARLR